MSAAVHEYLPIGVRVPFLEHEDVSSVGRRVLYEPPGEAARDPQRPARHAVVVRILRTVP